MSDKEAKEPADQGKAGSRVSEDELRAAFSGPAFHSNKIYLTLSGGGARLSFMEQHGPIVSPQFRTAVNMSMEDAISLKNLLIRQLDPIEEAIKTAPRVTAKKDGE